MTNRKTPLASSRLALATVLGLAVTATPALADTTEAETATAAQAAAASRSRFPLLRFGYYCIGGRGLQARAQ